MRRRYSPSFVITVLLLAAAWVGLWGTISVANVLSGLLVGATAVLLRPVASISGIKLAPLARLGWLILVDLASSTVQVAREVLTPTDYTDEGIIAVEIPAAAIDHALLLTSSITLTPGTAVVDIDYQHPAIFLHLLHLDRRVQVEAHVAELAALAVEALPHPGPCTGRGS
ncbi:MAG: Na+/H+ antiporter subunit E [Acidimicrobiia bacterium]|nr:Na+/H+ antiporter subunit E [Acidimicrobiia bacterium]